MGFAWRKKEPKQPDKENIRERKVKNVQKENYLLQQIDEFKEKAKQLQALLISKEEQIDDLENVVNEREEQAQELNALVKARREEADQLIVGVTVQIQEMIQALDRQMELFNGAVRNQITGMTNRIDDKLAETEEKIDTQLITFNEKVDSQLTTFNEKMDSQLTTFNEKMDSQLTALNGNINSQLASLDEKINTQLGENLTQTAQQTEEIKITVQEVKDSQESLKKDICEKIHSEDVKCYRNVKSLLEDQSEKFEQVTLSEEGLKSIQKSFKGLKFLAVFALLDFVVLIGFIILYQMGVF